MDKYTKVLLTVIAVSLVMISIRLWEPRSAEALFPDHGPTLGDLVRVQRIEDARKRENIMDQLTDMIPLSYVWFLRDGTLDVYVKGGSLD